MPVSFFSGLKKQRNRGLRVVRSFGVPGLTHALRITGIPESHLSLAISRVAK